MRGVKKENLPTKKCIICGLEFSWRKSGRKIGMKLNTVANYAEAKDK